MGSVLDEGWLTRWQYIYIEEDFECQAGRQVNCIYGFTGL